MRYLTMECRSTMHTCFTSASTTRATATGLNLSKDSRYSQTASKNTSYLTNSSKLPPLVLICTVTGPMKKLMNSSILAVWSAKIQTRFRCSKTWMSNCSYNWMPMNWIKSQIILLKRCTWIGWPVVWLLRGFPKHMKAKHVTQIMHLPRQAHWKAPIK